MVTATTQPSLISEISLAISSQKANRSRTRLSSCLVPQETSNAAPLLSTALITSPSPLASNSPKNHFPPPPPPPLPLPPRSCLFRHPLPHFLTVCCRSAIQPFNPVSLRQTTALVMAPLTKSLAAQSIALPANVLRPYSQMTREE